MTTKLYKRTMTLEKWYGNAVRIPSISSKQFESFATSCIGIASVMLEKKLDRNLKVGLSSQIDTAYADPKKSLVVISERFVRGDFSGVGHYDKLSAQKTVGALLGVIVHEIGHFAYSPVEVIRDGTNHIQNHTTKSYDFGLARTIVNILEDIYIENRISKETPSLGWTLDEINRILFPENKYIQDCKILSKLSAKPSNQDKINVLNFLLYAKMTGDCGKIAPFAAMVFKLARSVIRKIEAIERYDLALRIYDLIASDQIKLDNDQSDDQDQDQESSQNDATDQNQSIVDDSNDQMNDNDQESESDDLSGDLDGDSDQDSDQDSDNDQSLDSITSKPETIDRPQTINAFETTDQYEPYYEVVEIPQIQRYLGLDGHTITEQTIPSDKDALEMDQRYTRLAEVARQKTQSPKAFGAQQNRGRNLRQIHRIATDQKIFANPLHTNTVRPMEIIILIDCSSSMSAKNNKLLNASRAALGAAVGLLNGKSIVQVYGHSSDNEPKRNKIVHLYKLLGLNESPSILAQRLFKLNRHPWAYCMNSRDGYALHEIAKKFKSANRRRVILVISDGEPNGNGNDYVGHTAMDHTKKMVDQIRKSGIDVFSLSIDRHAFSPNNYIYGDQFNTCNVDPNAIDLMIRQLFFS